MATRRQTRYRQKRCLVICDGETEINYIRFVLSRYVNAQRKPGSTLKIVLRQNMSPDGVRVFLKKAPSDSYDGVFFLRDLERPNLAPGEVQNHCALVAAAEENGSSRPPWSVFFNMPSIEYWYILHFQPCAKPFQNADEAVKCLKKCCLKLKYEKPMPTSLAEARIFTDHVQDAVKNCEHCHPQGALSYAIPGHPAANPLSEMPALIAQLIHL